MESIIFLVQGTSDVSTSDFVNIDIYASNVLFSAYHEDLVFSFIQFDDNYGVEISFEESDSIRGTTSAPWSGFLIGIDNNGNSDEVDLVQAFNEGVIPQYAGRIDGMKRKVVLIVNKAPTSDNYCNLYDTIIDNEIDLNIIAIDSTGTLGTSYSCLLPHPSDSLFYVDSYDELSDDQTAQSQQIERFCETTDLTETGTPPPTPFPIDPNFEDCRETVNDLIVAIDGTIDVTQTANIQLAVNWCLTLIVLNTFYDQPYQFAYYYYDDTPTRVISLNNGLSKLELGILLANQNQFGGGQTQSDLLNLIDAIESHLLSQGGTALTKRKVLIMTAQNPDASACERKTEIENNFRIDLVFVIVGNNVDEATYYDCLVTDPTNDIINVDAWSDLLEPDVCLSFTERLCDPTPTTTTTTTTTARPTTQAPTTTTRQPTTKEPTQVGATPQPTTPSPTVVSDDACCYLKQQWRQSIPWFIKGC